MRPELACDTTSPAVRHASSRTRPGSRHVHRGASPMTENEERWAELRRANPATAERLLKDLRDLSRGRRTWAEILQIQDAELLSMAKNAAAKLEMGHAGEAERTFWALTALDPFVPWFWMALGD